MVVVAPLSVDLVEPVDLVFVDLVVNCIFKILGTHGVHLRPQEGSNLAKLEPTFETGDLN